VGPAFDGCGGVDWLASQRLVEVVVKTGGYGRIVAHLVSYPNVFKTDSGSDTDS
jgi:hypothetical protein